MIKYLRLSQLLNSIIVFSMWLPDTRVQVLKKHTVLWPPHVNSWLIGKDSDAGRDWGQEEKGTTEDEVAGWHHWLDRHEFEWTPGVGDGQGGLARCNSWGRKESDTTERLNWTELNWTESLLVRALSSCSVQTSNRMASLVTACGLSGCGAQA